MDQTNNPMSFGEKILYGLMMTGVAVYGYWILKEDQKFEAEAEKMRLAKEAEETQMRRCDREAREVIMTIRGIYDNLNNVQLLSVDPDSPAKAERRKKQHALLSDSIAKLEELRPYVGGQVASEIAYALTTARYAAEDLAEVRSQ